MGVNTGEVVVSFAEGPVIGERITGDVVNTASRLQSVAEPGGIVVGEATYRATRDRFQYRELPPASVKGKHEPLLIWEPTASRGRGGAEALTPPTTPMVGRDVELAMLKELYGRTVRDRSPMLVSRRRRARHRKDPIWAASWPATSTRSPTSSSRGARDGACRTARG